MFRSNVHSSCIHRLTRGTPQINPYCLTLCRNLPLKQDISAECKMKFTHTIAEQQEVNYGVRQQTQQTLRSPHRAQSGDVQHQLRLNIKKSATSFLHSLVTKS